MGPPRKIAPCSTARCARWAWQINGRLRREGRRAPGRGLPKAGGRALSPTRGAAQRCRLDPRTAQLGNVAQVHRATPNLADRAVYRVSPDRWPNGVKLRPHRCKIACVARRGQQVVAGDRLPDRIGIGVLAKVFPPDLVDRVVDEAGVREQRKRTLPARVVVYLLLAMVLFFQSGYGEVWNKLVQGLEWARQFRVRVALGMQPSPAAVTQARQRLGWPVMQRLLEAVAGPLAGEEQETAWVAGMRLVAIDGMCLDVPATAENGAEFGYPGNDAGPGPFPQIRVVGLGECGTRAVLGAELSPLAAGEQPLALKLLPRLNRGDLLLADRNFLSHGLLTDVLAAGVHVLWRAKSDIDLPVLEVLPDGTYLSRIADPAASRRMRRKGADPEDIPGIPVRVIEYSVTSADGSEISETFTLVTDITDPAALSAEQAADAYARRWQLETCFDELETSLRGGAAVVLRSKSPPMIRQEIYAMLCCYQAIRTLISHAADDAGHRPAADLLHRRPRGNPQPHQRLRMLFPLRNLTSSPPTWPPRSPHRHLVPHRPGRRYERKTKRPGGRYKTRKHGEATRLTPLTKVVFWLMPVPP